MINACLEHMRACSCGHSCTRVSMTAGDSTKEDHEGMIAFQSIHAMPPITLPPMQPCPTPSLMHPLQRNTIQCLHSNTASVATAATIYEAVCSGLAARKRPTSESRRKRQARSVHVGLRAVFCGYPQKRMPLRQ